MKYYLFKLTNEEPKQWALYEYNQSFSEKVREAPYLVLDILCKNGCSTHKLGNAYFVATTGTLEIVDGIARII